MSVTGMPCKKHYVMTSAVVTQKFAICAEILKCKIAKAHLTTAVECFEKHKYSKCNDC